MDCGTSIVKYILFIFNAIVCIIGIVGTVYGVILLNSIGVIEVQGQSAFPPQAIIPIGLITLCTIVVLISFEGCCGAIREDVCMTFTYAVFMLILLIVQLVAIVLLFTNKEKIQDNMGKVIDNFWNNNPNEFEPIQKAFKCCGSNGAADYVLIGKLPPPSCCEHESCINPLNIYGGCRNKFQEYIALGTENIKFFALGLITVELIGFIFACCLANNVRNYKRRNAY